MKKFYLLLTFAFLSANILSNSEQTFEACPTFTIDEAIQQALSKKISIHAHLYAIENYKHLRTGTTFATFLPNVSVTETAYNNALTVRHAFGISASQTVINLGQVDNYKMYSSYMSSAKHDMQAHKDSIRFSTETAFLSAWLIQQKLNLILLQFTSSKKTFEQAKKQYELALLDKNEWLKAKATHVANLATVNTYKDEVAQAEKELEFYTTTYKTLLPVGKDNESPTILSWNPEQPIKVEPFEIYYQKALKNRKDLKSKQDTINLKKHTSKYYTKQYIPSVSVFGNATKSRYRAGGTDICKEAGIKVSWNAFDGLANYFNKSAADAEKLKATLEKNDLKAQVKYEVQKAYSALQKELNTLTGEKVSFRQKANEFELNKQQIQTGLISPVDFQNAEYNYENARISWFSQAATAALKKRELLFACGYPTE